MKHFLTETKQKAYLHGKTRGLSVIHNLYKKDWLQWFVVEKSIARFNVMPGHKILAKVGILH